MNIICFLRIKFVFVLFIIYILQIFVYNEWFLILFQVYFQIQIFLKVIFLCGCIFDCLNWVCIYLVGERWQFLCFLQLIKIKWNRSFNIRSLHENILIICPLNLFIRSTLSQYFLVFILILLYTFIQHSVVFIFFLNWNFLFQNIIGCCWIQFIYKLILLYVYQIIIILLICP